MEETVKRPGGPEGVKGSAEGTNATTALGKKATTTIATLADAAVAKAGTGVKRRRTPKPHPLSTTQSAITKLWSELSRLVISTDRTPDTVERCFKILSVVIANRCEILKAKGSRTHINTNPVYCQTIQFSGSCTRCGVYMEKLTIGGVWYTPNPNTDHQGKGQLFHNQCWADFADACERDGTELDLLSPKDALPKDGTQLVPPPEPPPPPKPLLSVLCQDFFKVLEAIDPDAEGNPTMIDHVKSSVKAEGERVAALPETLAFMEASGAKPANVKSQYAIRRRHWKEENHHFIRRQKNRKSRAGRKGATDARLPSAYRDVSTK